MKKTLALIFSAIIMIASTAVPAFAVLEAPAGDVKFGKPVLDGKMDDIYAESWSWTINASERTTDGTAEGTETASAYAVADADSLYVYVEVKSPKNAWCEDTEKLFAPGWDGAPGPWPYNLTDAVELRITFLDGKTYEFFCDYEGQLDINWSGYAGGYNYTAVEIDSSTYAIEAEFPFVYGETEGSVIELGVQVDNYDDGYVCAYNGDGQRAKLTLTGNAAAEETVEAVEEILETPEEVIEEAPVVEEAVTEEPASAETVQAPQTFDTAVIAAAAAIITAAGYAAAKKK